MGKLNLVIADIDENYIKSLEKYIIMHYSQRFDIYSFTAPEYFNDFLQKSIKRIDILLFNNLFFPDPLPLNIAVVQIMLTEDMAVKAPEGFKTIFKYRHTEKLVADILSIYSQKSRDNYLPLGQRNTIITAVFSPEGGSGKTSIAAGCSALCARRGLKVFYLNLESMPSTAFYFKGAAEQNFSNIIYYLKEKENNLIMKMEGARCIDTGCNVHFFQPPDSMLELEELLPDDFEHLIGQFRISSQYDAVFIDMSNGFNLCNMAVLKACDIILQVSLPDAASIIRTGTLISELELLKHSGSLDLTGKTVKVMNKYKEGLLENNDESAGFKVIINECEELKHITGAGQLADMGTAFSTGLSQLLEEIIPEKGESKYKLTGGVTFA